eukprot:TRINITY_DN3596_c0_g1_i8.p1 TRINITY_DN3596_c0_g1~~TRINITY_DN3596_c0_g1_i8.p1  ORF type:complete len:307 (-),score=43.58 TRINITY_DN3596_c0_g1_i8:265-1185(-)
MSTVEPILPPSKAYVRKASCLNGIFNFVNTIMGGGVLALPNCARESGLAAMLTILVIEGLLCFYSQHLLVYTSFNQFGDSSSYALLAQKSFGPRIGNHLNTIFLVLYSIGTLVGYQVILGSGTREFIVDYTSWQSASPKITEVIVSVVVLLPLCCLRRVQWLAWASFLAIFVIFCLAILLVVYSSVSLKFHGLYENINFGWDIQGTLKSIPVVVLTYAYHANIFVVWDELEVYTPERVSTISGISIFIAFFTYSSVCVFGYLLFVDKTPSDILDAFNKSDWLGQTVKGCYLFVIAFSYPLVHFPLR